jgi:8-amino-7-oxononanoate synthase
MREAYRDLGFDIGGTETPIVPIFVGDSLRAMHVWRSLFDAGIYVNVAIPPAVPPGKALLRTSYMATHTDEQMERVLDAFASVGKSQGLIP